MCGVDLCDAATEFTCSRGKSCVNSSQQCDGSTHCSDSSDEADCCQLSPNTSISIDYTPFLYSVLFVIALKIEAWRMNKYEAKFPRLVDRFFIKLFETANVTIIIEC